MTYQGLLLEQRRHAIKHEDRLDFVVEEFADAVKEDNQVSIRDGLASSRAHSLDSLVQPNADI